MQNPYERVPGDLVPDVVRAGVGVVGAYWPGVADGPDGFELPSNFQDFVELQRLVTAYQDALREHYETSERFFPLSHGGESVRYGDTITEEALDELDRLRALEAERLAAYRQFIVEHRPI